MIDFLNENTPLTAPYGRVVVIAGLFVVAWLVARLIDRLAVRLIARNEARQAGERGPVDTGVIANLRQQETAISLVQASVRYLVYGLAVVLSIIVLSGADRVETLVGASFIALVLAFSAREVVADVIAGLLMVFDGWVRVGTTVTVEPWGVRGVIEEMSVRSLTIRALNGELIHVRNAEVKALRVVPGGVRQFQVELFVSDVDATRDLIGEINMILPKGATQFVRAPEIRDIEALDDELARVEIRAAVAPGREWLVEEVLPELLNERAPVDTIVHGPVIIAVDEQATRRFALATGARPTGE